jgi:hypothetical protein
MQLVIFRKELSLLCYRNSSKECALFNQKVDDYELF